jgi:hypothetical protein
VGPPGAAVGDPADLLHIDVDHVARVVSGVMVPGRRNGPPSTSSQSSHDRPARRRILAIMQAAIDTPSAASSRPIRAAEYFLRRRARIRSTTTGGATVGELAGRLE